MFLKAFYTIKPLIPRRLQISMRRFRARVKLLTQADIWPVHEEAATPPKNWMGWPDGKKFAFILTHDVDTAKGQERCRDLIDLERRMGFVASYNFVPERYKVNEGLRNYLTENGFEVGVHGLNHDGKYFSSRSLFRKRAIKINRYLRDWGSVGYRSPSMLHNLAWLHELDIQYDSSTFDTDPFEPQPDGVGTIFPFWVPSGNGTGGYLEIPYTLPQDFTLFVIMQHRNIDMWKRKLDWIASKGGMALMLIHPDYVNKGNSICGREEYPIKFFSDFLEYVQKKYGGEYYHVLPKDLAKLWKENYLSKL
jgi:peptidoglycan/xylan/chitin deacetylase (PgdA/CDA1 family)